MQKKVYKTKAGYTIIETMIAVSLFLVIVLSGMSALLSANLVNNESENMRSIVDSLSFIMEEMSRNLRTGYNYRCVNDGNYANFLDIAKSCSQGKGIIFEEANGKISINTDQWIYKIESSDGGITYNIFKSTNGGADFVQLNPSEVILNSTSGFSVLGAEPPTSDTQQPLVKIRLVGEIHYKDIIAPFSLQTSVSQRLIDIII